MINSYLRVFRRSFVILVACVASTTLFAQSQNGISLDALLQRSDAVLRQIDARNAAAAWDDASSVMRESTKKDEFVGQVENVRSGLGPISSRLWQTIARISYGNGNVERIPPGDYVSINFLVIDNNGRFLQELISFRFEDERQWRLTGYVSQKAAAK